MSLSIELDATRVRELAARSEGPGLDFKSADYDWLLSKANAELAKDLMAMANVLGPGATPAYIMVGVSNDGHILGCPVHIDDAKLHQKVKGLLNRVPVFTYNVVDVDGAQVGVYEILPGGRPFFPVVDNGVLKKNIALYRSGSSTDVASPTMIIEWHQADDPDAHRLRTLQLRDLEAQSVVYGSLDGETVNSDGLSMTLKVKNTGARGFSVRGYRYRTEWSPYFLNYLNERNKHLPVELAAPQGERSFNDIYVPPGEERFFIHRWSGSDMLDHLKDLALTETNDRWLVVHIEVPCHGELGGETTLSYKKPGGAVYKIKSLKQSD
jgi:hypothetical protein